MGHQGPSDTGVLVEMEEKAPKERSNKEVFRDVSQFESKILTRGRYQYHENLLKEFTKVGFIRKIFLESAVG